MDVSRNKTPYQSQEMLERTVRNSQDFKQALDDLTEELQKRIRAHACNKGLGMPFEADPTLKIWYRGQPNHEHVLIPSLHRAAHALPKEKDIFDEYRRKRPGNTHASCVQDDWTVLFEMQHYGVPTRLLDWTERCDIALFFALQEPERNRPVLYLLSPALLNNHSDIPGLQGAMQPDVLRKLCPSYIDYLKEVNSTDHACAGGPIAIAPVLVDERIRAQIGCFTIHGRCRDPIERQSPNSVARIVFTEAAAKEQWSMVERSLQDYIVFPDREGLSIHIRKVFSLDNLTRLLGHQLHQRWQKDLKSAPADWAPLFSGLRGCAIGKQYITAASKKKPALEKWMDQDMAVSGRVCFILGDAGAGKTNYILSAVRHLYYRKDNKPRYGTQTDKEPEAVLWCALGHMRPGQEILAAVAETLTRLDESPPLTIDVNTVRALCRTQSTVLVLDGLDELARTRSNHEARRIIREAARELHDLHKLRVIVGCRSHVYRNMVRAWTRDLGEVKEINVLSLDKGEVAKALSIPQESKACEITAEVPLFLAALRRFSIHSGELSNVSSEAQLRNLILRKATSAGCKLNDLHEVEMRKLGCVAALMIEKRKDYLSDEDLLDHYEEKQIIRYYEKKPKWPLFVQESGKEWRFIHQSIREYILAWNVFDGFANPEISDSLTNQSTSLDFESAEVYCFLHELIEEDKKKRFRKGVEDCLKPKKEHDQAQWNRRMRNLFEAVGMLGVACSADILRETLKNALEIIENPKRRDFPYANFVTAYNAARCVERLHSSGPKSYCRYRRGSWREKASAKHDVKYLKLHAYAVRGFHRKQQDVAIETPMPLRDYVSQKDRPCMHGTSHDKELENRTVQCLKSALTRLIGLPELDKHQEFMAANLSHAIIRWLPHDGKELAWLREQLTRAKQKSYSHVVANLQLALYYRGESEYAYRTVKNNIFASSEVHDTSLLQVLLTEVTLERTGLDCRIDVHIPKDPIWIWTSSQKESFIRQCSEGKESVMTELQKQVEEILIDRKERKLKLRDKLEKGEMKLRFASGGTLPILEIEGSEYYCLFYREIYPIGWNIANGGSANLKEILDPILTIQREFAEELVIIDKTQGYRYHFYEESTNNKNRDSTLRLLEVLNLTSNSGKWEHKLLAPEMIPAQDRISINRRESSNGIFLNVNMVDLGIEIDQVVKVCGLRETVALLDGETEDYSSAHTSTPGFINAPVGLFRTDRLTDPQSNREFIPDILFRSGKLKCGGFNCNGRNDGRSNDEVLSNRIKGIVNQFAEERLEPLPSDSWDAYIKAREEGRAYDLCPATRTLLRQYLT